MRGHKDVAIAYLHRNLVAHSFMQSYLRWMLWDLQHDTRMALMMPNRAEHSADVGRNQVAEIFVDSDAEYLWWIDDDMGFAPDTLDRLLAEMSEEVPIVGALCFKWQETDPDPGGGYRTVPLPTVYRWLPSEDEDTPPRFKAWMDYPRDQLVQVAGTGSACIVIHRSVYEAMAERRSEDPSFGQFYDRIRGSDGSLLGEDVSFCIRAASLGLPIHVHTGIGTNHLKNVWVSEETYRQALIVAQVDSESVEPEEQEQVADPPITGPVVNRAERRRRRKVKT